MNILNDTEHRIFLSAMAREKEICQKIDGDKIYDSTVKMLVPVCESIERKVDRAISLDKVKQAREKIEKLRDEEIITDQRSEAPIEQYITEVGEGLELALDILDELIESGE